MQLFRHKTTLAILSFSVLFALLVTARLVRPLNFDAVIDFRPRSTPAEPVRQPQHRNRVPVAFKRTNEPGNGLDYLSEPQGSLDAFYRALMRTAAGRGVTRILHYGDSPVTADSITADVRSLLQEEFGDGGHGFVLIAKPWAWYGHRGVEVSASGWRIEPASQSHARDGYHGLGGVSFRGNAGAVSQVHLATAHNRTEIAFLRQPDGGSFAISACDSQIGQVSTAGADVRPDWASFTLPPHCADISLRVQSGTVRIFGYSFEKSGSGLLYNSLGLNGGQVQVVLRYFEPSHWTAELQHARPDLVIVNYGTNESIFPRYIDTYYAGELREVIRRVKAAVPDASILVMGPMDRGERDPATHEISTVPVIRRIIEIQRQAAAQTGCGFFNTFEAMGGPGTMARWYSAQPRLVSADFMHPLPGGARKLGELLDQALTGGFERATASRVER